MHLQLSSCISQYPQSMIFWPQHFKYPSDLLSPELLSFYKVPCVTARSICLLSIRNLLLIWGLFLWKPLLTKFANKRLGCTFHLDSLWSHWPDPWPVSHDPFPMALTVSKNQSSFPPYSWELIFFYLANLNKRGFWVFIIPCLLKCFFACFYPFISLIPHICLKCNCLLRWKHKNNDWSCTRPGTIFKIFSGNSTKINMFSWHSWRE